MYNKYEEEALSFLEIKRAPLKILAYNAYSYEDSPSMIIPLIIDSIQYVSKTVVVVDNVATQLSRYMVGNINAFKAIRLIRENSDIKDFRVYKSIRKLFMALDYKNQIILVHNIAFYTNKYLWHEKFRINSSDRETSSNAIARFYETLKGNAIYSLYLNLGYKSLNVYEISILLKNVLLHKKKPLRMYKVFIQTLIGIIKYDKPVVNMEHIFLIKGLGFISDISTCISYMYFYECLLEDLMKRMYDYFEQEEYISIKSFNEDSTIS